MRINVQLIDAACGDHIWAERFDRNLEDIFGLQDEVTDKIVEALVGRLARPPSRKRPKSLEAYDLCVRGRILISAFNSSPEALREAKILLNHAVSIDAEYGEAFRCLAFVYWQLWAQGIEPTQENRSRAFELAHKAVALDEGDAASHWFVGYLWAYEKRWSESDQAFAITFTLEPNNADALATFRTCGLRWARIGSGRTGPKGASAQPAPARLVLLATWIRPLRCLPI